MGIKCSKYSTDNTSDSQFCKKCAEPLPSQKQISISHTKTVVNCHKLAELGELDRAYEWMEKAYEERETFLALFKTRGEFEKLHSVPGIKVQLKKIGFMINNTMIR